jgi:preprotein translocase subunit SecE
MATEEDLKKAEEDESPEDESEAAASSDDSEKKTEDSASGDEGSTALAKAGAKEDDSPADAKGDEDEEVDGESAPVQLGYQRYVYAAYMAGAMIAAFLVAKIGHAGWYKLGQWKPQFGEPKDEIVFPVAAVVGILVALYYWRKPESRQYANEVAEELSKVTWPSRKEVTNSTTVVVLTTVFATVFFALMDRFWSFITDKIYTF